MKKTNNRQMSDSLKIGVLLAFVGGFLDAYTYLLRGKVFANAQTGNTVLLGLNLFQGEFKKALNYLIPIIAFIVGIFISDFINLKFKKNKWLHWRQIIIIIEIILLILVAFIPQSLNDIANIIISFTCAIQLESFRKIDGVPYATTICTGNLRSGTEFLFKYIETKKYSFKTHFINYYLINLTFALGAGIGCLLVKKFNEPSILFSCFILALGFMAMFIKEDINRKTT